MEYLKSLVYRRVDRGSASPRAEKVHLERSKDELTNAKDESFLLICQRTQLFAV